MDSVPQGSVHHPLLCGQILNPLVIDNSSNSVLLDITSLGRQFPNLYLPDFSLELQTRIQPIAHLTFPTCMFKAHLKLSMSSITFLIFLPQTPALMAFSISVGGNSIHPFKLKHRVILYDSFFSVVFHLQFDKKVCFYFQKISRICLFPPSLLLPLSSEPPSSGEILMKRTEMECLPETQQEAAACWRWPVRSFPREWRMAFHFYEQSCIH